MNGDPTLERIARGNGLALCAAGSWTARFAPVLEEMVADAEKLTGSRPNIFIDVSQVSKLDTFGAWLIERLRRSLTQGGVEAKIAGLSAELFEPGRRGAPGEGNARGRHHIGDDYGHAGPGRPQHGRHRRHRHRPDRHARRRAGRERAGLDSPPRLPVDLNRASSGAGMLARGADRRADYLSDRLHHLPAGHLSLPQIRRGYLRGRYARRAGAARNRRAAGGDHGGGPLGECLHRRARLHEDAGRDRCAPHHGVRSDRGA